MPSSKSVALNAKVITEGLAFGESPRWHDGRLWLCNWGTGEIVAVDEDGGNQVMLTVPAILPYSIDWLPDGRLLIVSGRDGLLLRQEADGTLATHADLRSLSTARGTRSSSTGAATSMSMAAGRRLHRASISGPAPSC
ncbi:MULTISPECIES: SMP-30/gluconolactonase/LRE family protein [unclassified Mesorhizobium]|uniref:SMP-30/gluconolactonase/LRE family protein n=1 Tax=unclassified Mesorhizobium TaxID=325217 RepID=UPI0003CDD6E4|nr:MULTISPECIES: SMP-30/gluconolactonase/LRE family protein [unclassified Mesorhizobium]ESX17919.1 hypothetical protein X766_16675 [Mesorhizobium sp. LSJC255A00]ESX25281.1 hypothetical protein X765_26215 [Mesorhizobium sp. LSHC440B00]ESX36514.1 hypothetical protein X763_16405 [Mesorhizobium sp. LSHC432A00]ESX38314.1 hypothetical protein X764_22570 [Mesorhizobium sp. LSHC440A00]ESX74605.1 hypothetical protein X757_18165 [Mesorhizobium sp. LSHC414A00]